MSDNDHNNGDIVVPAITESGAKHTGQSSEQENYAPVTEHSFPQRPFAQKLTDLADEENSSFGGRIGKQLTAAAFNQLENDLKDARALNLQHGTEIKTLTRDNSNLQIENAVIKSENRTLKRINWVNGFLYILGSLLIGFGWSEGEEPNATILFVLGALCIAGGLLSPALFSSKET